MCNAHDEYELASWQCDLGDVVVFVTSQFGLGDVVFVTCQFGLGDVVFVTCQFGLGDVGYGKLVKLMWT